MIGVLTQLQLVLTIIASILESFATQNIVQFISDTSEIKGKYDFIVIGSGSGGSVVANRLSENSDWNILLLEAGIQENLLTDVPLTAALTYVTRYNWGYRTDPVPGACLALKDGLCNWPKGRALGGTSVINFLLYQRGHKQDYNDWADQGCNGWSYADVLPYFIKSEKINFAEKTNLSYRGTNGFLSVEYSPYRSELLQAFLDAGLDMGYENNDPNGESLLGFSRVQATMRNGRRCSAAKAYLQPIAGRKNLHVSMKSRVTKILINPLTKNAYGVEFLKDKKRYSVLARREVILSAGTIASPQLLMLSGVGPSEHLQKFNIPVMSDLRVGYNLQDHTSVSGLVFPIEKPITIIETSVQNPVDIFSYIFGGKGPFTSPGGAEGIAFLKLNDSTLAADYPDVEVVMGAGALTGDISGTLRNMLGISKEFFDTVYKDVIGKHAFGLVPISMRPKSRGRIKLKSSNPFQWPSMQPNYFQDPFDMSQLIQGIKIALKIAESRSFNAMGVRFHDTPFLGCEHLVFKSDQYWECCIRHYTSSLQHQVGTCKMGNSTDNTAVVNSNLQVYGINNLRVVDASIMPILPAAHTNAVVYMIGEKAADMIKDYWLKEPKPII